MMKGEVSKVGLYVDDSLLGRNREDTIRKGELTLQDKIYVLMTDYNGTKDIVNEYPGYEISYIAHFSFPGENPWDYDKDKIVKNNAYIAINYSGNDSEGISYSIYGPKFNENYSFFTYGSDDVGSITGGEHISLNEDDIKDYHTNKEEKTIQKINHDMNDTFNQYVQEVYGCTYQKDCQVI